ncbi:hypothetical protein TNCT_348891 [Trichonephila clavata]|uniref:Uncharacterized protein n=1 Tax=Trichonephila clavata TaxID=2740835 RepID=A0A8X6HAD0_TRICU|nr:hypothetical protein TNCT_348891 [Trichonephila clavata]
MTHSVVKGHVILKVQECCKPLKISLVLSNRKSSPFLQPLAQTAYQSDYPPPKKKTTTEISSGSDNCQLTRTACPRGKNRLMVCQSDK